MLLAGALLLLASCVSSPPRHPDDLCAIFREKRDWHREARSTHERWGVSPSAQLAIVHQESRFRARARPPRRRLLGFIPGPRVSSAYGYAQAQEGTWDDYRRSTGRGGADRDDFGDAVDFIGWYADAAHRRAAVARTDVYNLYLAYHEGIAGFRRETWRKKSWLPGVAHKVASRARRYASQYASCREELERRRRFWPFS